MLREGLVHRYCAGYVYAERKRDLGIDGAVTADEWAVLPERLHRDIDECGQLIIVDPLSFPLDDLRKQDWSRLITVVWPQSVPETVAIELLDGPLLSKLTFFDTFLVDDDARWEELRSLYRFSESQRMNGSGRSLDEVITRRLRSGQVAERAARELVARRANPIDPWTLRSSEEKSSHLVEYDALSVAVQRVQASQPAERHIRLLHVGMGIGRFTSLLSQHEYTGFSRGPATTAQARLNFPSLPILQLGSEQQLPVQVEGTDLAVVTHEMSMLPTDSRRKLIEAVWRSLRVGGKLIILDTFSPHRGQRAIAMDQLTDDLLHATRHQLVVSDVASLKSPHSPMRNIGVLTFTKIGVPTTW